MQCLAGCVLGAKGGVGGSSGPQSRGNGVGQSELANHNTVGVFSLRFHRIRNAADKVWKGTIPTLQTSFNRPTSMPS